LRAFHLDSPYLMLLMQLRRSEMQPMLDSTLPTTLGSRPLPNLGGKLRMSAPEEIHEAQESGGPDGLSNEKNLHFE
jgi:hypothetical protein